MTKRSKEGVIHCRELQWQTQDTLSHIRKVFRSAAEVLAVVGDIFLRVKRPKQAFWHNKVKVHSCKGLSELLHMNPLDWVSRTNGHLVQPIGKHNSIRHCKVACLWNSVLTRLQVAYVCHLLLGGVVLSSLGSPLHS